MKKTFKTLILTITIMALLVNVFVFNVSAAANVTVSGGEYNVGQKVSITVNISNDTPIMTAQVGISYDPAVLTLNNVSGSEFTQGNGSINIVDDNFSTASKDVTTGSYTLSFTAAAAGSSRITANVSIADKNLSKSTTSSSATVSVVVPKPSSNANLSSIKLSDGSLTPAFKANTTSYSATVKYSVEKITISASVADGGATVTGAGTINLEVGDNSRVILVTAADGTKKSYTVNIKRMTEQETLEAEQAARDADPLLVVIDNADYRIVNSFEGAHIPSGFTPGTAMRKETEVAVLNDDHGEYQLFWLVDANGENGAFYTRDENDRFTKVAYINTNGKMYIVEDVDVEGYVPAGYEKSTRVIDNTDVEAYNFTEKALKDFYIVKCYVAGARAYYRFDSVEGTLQRAVEFDLAVEAANAEPVEIEKSAMSWFTDMNKTGKAVFFIIVFVAVIFIAVSVLLIIKITSSAKEDMDYDYMLENDSFVLNDFSAEDEDETDGQNEVELQNDAVPQDFIMQEENED